MTTINISKRFDFHGLVTERVAAVCRMFGLTIDRLKAQLPNHQCSISFQVGDIIYITGPSGAGKSVLLNQIQKCIPAKKRINLNKIKLPADRTCIDCFSTDILSSLQTLSTAGLSDVFSILNTPARLSEGQQYRFRLAMALAAGKEYIFADEFCSELDRITAAVISHKIRKFADNTKTTFFLASSHEDLLADLLPDAVVIKQTTGPAQVTYRNSHRKAQS